jgi:hypothetical protein
MNMFGFIQRLAARKPGGQQAEARAKKRRSNRDRSDLGQQSNGVRSGERSVHELLGTAVERPENVARTKEVHKFPISTVKEPVNVPALESVQTKGADDILNGIAAGEGVVCSIQRAVDGLLDNLIRQFQQRAEADGVFLSAQKGVVEQWKQEAGALMTEWRQEATALVTVLTQLVGTLVSATAAVVEAEKQNNGSVHAAEKSKAAAKIGSKESRDWLWRQ